MTENFNNCLLFYSYIIDIKNVNRSDVKNFSLLVQITYMYIHYLNLKYLDLISRSTEIDILVYFY